MLAFSAILLAHNIRVHPRDSCSPPSHPTSVLICAICGRYHLQLECSPADATDYHRFFSLITDLSDFTKVAPLRYPEIWLIWCQTSSSQCKPRRLWRLAVAPQPSTARNGYHLAACYHLVYVAAWLRRDAIASYVSFFCNPPRTQHPCASERFVFSSFAPNIRVHLCYLWEIPSAAWYCSPTDSTDYHSKFAEEYDAVA